MPTILLLAALHILLAAPSTSGQELPTTIRHLCYLFNIKDSIITSQKNYPPPFRLGDVLDLYGQLLAHGAIGSDDFVACRLEGEVQFAAPVLTTGETDEVGPIALLRKAAHPECLTVGGFPDTANAMLAAREATEDHRIAWCPDEAVTDNPTFCLPVAGQVHVMEHRASKVRCAALVHSCDGQREIAARDGVTIHLSKFGVCPSCQAPLDFDPRAAIEVCFLFRLSYPAHLYVTVPAEDFERAKAAYARFLDEVQNGLDLRLGDLDATLYPHFPQGVQDPALIGLEDMVEDDDEEEVTP
jgi:hypothetical protein